MLRVLLQGPGSISKYGRCGCAKKKKKKAENQEKIGMIDDKCCGRDGMVQGAFPNMEGVAVQKKKKA
jgi:hypothetical protein